MEEKFKCPSCGFENLKSDKICANCKKKLKTRSSCCGPLFLFLILGIGAFWYFITPACDLPKKYSIGTVDSRFKISDVQVLALAKDAETRWEQAAGGQDLLEYDPKAKMKINLIYDERQQNLDTLNFEADKLGNSSDSIESWNTKLQSILNKYENDLATYNQKVATWNSRGGAPENIYNQLEEEAASLDFRRQEINKMASLLNTQIDQHNSNINSFNDKLASQENKLITQGLYYPQDDKIDIFTYYDKLELRLVLMHELGHAIGIDHTAGENSLMYPVLNKQKTEDPKPLAEDLDALKTTCSL